MFALKPLWNGFGKDSAYPYFYTLGAASYLDGTQPDVYAAKVKKSNDVMQIQFADLYHQLKQTLADFLKCESSQLIFEPGVALPGFHIYPRKSPNGGVIHVDAQIHQTPWKNPSELNFQEAWSMTLALQLPKSGGGLRYWPTLNDRSLQEMKSKMTDIELRQECEKLAPVQVPYDIGTLYLFHPRLVHQIMPNIQVEDGEARVTLQAHAVRKKTGEWVLFF